MDSGFDPTIAAINTALNLRLMNQNVISSNIANADTPGFKSKTMDFESTLRGIIQSADSPSKILTTNSKHIAPNLDDPVFPEVYEDPNGIESLDGNSVDRSAEMSKMAENQLLYDAATEVLKRKLGMLKYALSEGGGNR